MNLIDNIIRYTQKGEIELKVEKIDSAIRVSIRDTGEGLIWEEQRDILRASAEVQLVLSILLREQD